MLVHLTGGGAHDYIVVWALAVLGTILVFYTAWAIRNVDKATHAEYGKVMILLRAKMSCGYLSRSWENWFFTLIFAKVLFLFREWTTLCSCLHLGIGLLVLENMEPEPDVFSNRLGSQWWDWDMDLVTKSMTHNLLCLQDVLRQWLLRAYGSAQPMTVLMWGPRHVRDSVVDTA